MEQSAERFASEVRRSEVTEYDPEYHDLTQQRNAGNVFVLFFRQQHFQDEQDQRETTQREFGANGSPLVRQGSKFNGFEIHSRRQTEKINREWTQMDADKSA